MKTILLRKLSFMLLLAYAGNSAHAQNYQWSKSLGSSASDRALSVAYDASGNTLVTGSFTGTVDFDPGPGKEELAGSLYPSVFIAKYDVNGNFIWAKAIPKGTENVGTGIAVTPDDGVVVSGYFGGTVDFDPGPGTDNHTSLGVIDPFLIKLDKNGNLVWAKTIRDTYNGFAYNVATDKKGNIYMSGTISSDVDFNPGGSAPVMASIATGTMFFAKYDALGICTWVKVIGDPSGSQYLKALTVDDKENVYIGGNFYGKCDADPGSGTKLLTALYVDLFYAKYDKNGSLLWAGNTGVDKNVASVNSIAVDALGNVGITGHFYGTCDFDPGTGTANLAGGNNMNAYVAQYDATGKYKWGHSISDLSGSMFSKGNSISFDASGTVYVSGVFGGTVDFDPSGSTANLNAVTTNHYLAVYDGAGKYVTAKSLASKKSLDIDNTISVNPLSGIIYMAGSFSDTTDFDLGPGVANQVNTGGMLDIFIAKYRMIPSVIFDIGYASELINIFPNPAGKSAMIYYELMVPNDAVIKVYNASGQMIFTKILTQQFYGPNEYQLDLRSYAAGTYFVEIRSGAQHYSGKLVHK